MNTFALVCGCDYSGSWKVYQSKNDAVKFKKLLTDLLEIPEKNISTLYDSEFTYDRTIKALNNLAKKLSQPNTKGIIYIAGHGTQIRDTNGDEADGRDEAWQTYDRRTIPDDLVSEIMLKTHPNCTVVVISDSCHSGTMLDMREDRNWISIGAAQDYQCALQTGDGSVMSYHLFKLILRHRNISYRELRTLLDDSMRGSFVGELQICRVEWSNERIADDNF